MVLLGNDGASDTPTSSSENESIASATSLPRWASGQDRNTAEMDSDTESDDPAPRPSKWDVDTPPPIPHRVLKVRRLLFDAFHSALTILHETRPHPVTITESGKQGRPKAKGDEITVKLDVKEPWMRLSRTVGALKGSVGGLRDGDNVSRLSMIILHFIISQRVVSLANDKQYIRTLARNEAKAIPSLLKSWSKIPVLAADPPNGADMDHSKDDELFATLDVAPIITLRLAHKALFGIQRYGLDLSSLGLAPSVLDNVSIPALCAAFGMARDEIKSLDLSLNGWKRLPAWLSFPFPNLVSLDLTNNAPMAHLPLSLIQTPISKVHARGTQLAETSAPVIRSLASDSASQIAASLPKHSYILNPSARPHARTSGPITLAHTLLRMYTIVLRPHYPPSTMTDLPPHILHMLSETYRCELCLVYQYPDQATWVEGEVERAWMLVEAERRLVRVKGRVCRSCEGRYLRPIEMAQ